MIKMLINNNIVGLLDTRLDMINSLPSLSYDVTSRHSLSTLLENQSVDYTLLSSILLHLYNTCETLNGYMLESCFLLLSPEYIFLNPENKIPTFCYCPIEENDSEYSFSKQLNILLDFIIAKLDYTDKECVALAYSLHQKCISNMLSMEDLLPSFQNCTLQSKADYKLSASTKCADSNCEASTEIPSDLSLKSSSPISSDTSCEASSISEASLIFGLPVRFAIIICTVLISSATLILSSAYFYFIAQKFSFYMFVVLTAVGLAIVLLSMPYFINKRKYYAYLSEQTTVLPDDKNLPDIMPIGDTILMCSEVKPLEPHLIYSGSDFSQDINIHTFPFTIGKLPESSDFIINNSLVSRIHARFYFKDDSYYIEDLNSSNGTYINSTPISPHTMFEIKDGDFITFAHLTYIFKLC